MAEERLTCPWCGADAVVDAADECPLDGRDEVSKMSWSWRCTSRECQSCGPWRPTREEAVGTMRHVWPEDQSNETHGTIEKLRCLREKAEAALAEERRRYGELVEACDKLSDQNHMYVAWGTNDTHSVWNGSTGVEVATADHAADAILAWAKEHR